MKNKFAERLRNYRYYTGESRKTLGEAIGATVSAIRTWEDGRHNCSFDDLLKISEHYGITTDYLLGNTPIDDPESAKIKPDPLPPEDRIALMRFEEYLFSRQNSKKK
ncbi:MAG: helix-turn-helix domain-containing protein [Clostridia bacterium]|nr:helix-turn-helix domain-containing protein [Clostridia bacterium]